MFKRIKYELSSAMINFVNVEIWVKGGKLHYSKIATGRPDEYTDDTVSTVSAEDFAKKLEALHIGSWKKDYQPQGYIVMDGVSWTVEYEDTDGKKVKSSGDNAYPSNWSAFRKLLATVAGNVKLD